MANQGQQGGGNQGNRGGQPRQNKPPRQKCPQCGQDNDNAAKHCAACGKPLMVTCPNTNCGAVVKNTAHCSRCGTALNPAPAAPGAKPKDDYALEVTPVGSRGKYQIAIQATKGGKGAQVTIYVLETGKTCKQHQTDANGFLSLTFKVKTRETKLGIGIAGTQKNLERLVTLYGVPPKIEGNSWKESLKSFKERFAYWYS